MARKLKGQGEFLSGSPSPNFTNFSPKPIQANRAPTTADTGYEIGQLWADTNGTTMYGLSAVSAGSATWNLLGPGASDVDTVTADSGGALSPAAGNINILGGTNMTTAGSGSTVTINMDAAISLATSVTSPIYTASAADLNINAAASQEIILQMGDNAGSNKVSFEDSDSTEVASIDSSGNATFAGNIVMSSVATQLQMNGGAATDFIGQATLVSGTVTVANTNIAANDRIFLTRSDANSSTALGMLTVTAKTASTSFVITALDPADGASTITGDVSVVDYFIVRQS